MIKRLRGPTRTIAAGLVILFFGVALSHGSSAVTNDAKTVESPLTQTVAYDKYGTSKLPLVVEVKENDGDRAEKAAAEWHRTQEATASRNIMYFTGAAVFVALGQLAVFFWQLRLLRKSVKDTGLAAEAAILSARAAIGIELPVLRVAPVDLISTDRRIESSGPYGGLVNDRAPTKFSAIGNFLIKNLGRTPAFPDEIAIGWAVATALSGAPNYLHRSRLNHASVIQPGDEYMADIHYGIELSDADVAAARSGTAWLWVYGCVYYVDFLENRREYRSCWRFANRNHDSVFYHFASDGEPPSAYVQNSIVWPNLSSEGG